MKTNDKNIFSTIDGLLNSDKIENKKYVYSDIVPLEKAPNAVIFMEEDRFLGIPELFPYQFDIIRDFFQLLCPNCNDTNRIYTKNDIPRDYQILFEHNKCPNCGITKKEIGHLLKKYNELVAIIGMRSGKSALAAFISLYILHEVLCVNNFAQKLKLLKRQRLEGCFVAVSKDQAADTVYDYFRGFYDDSPWFQNYKKALLDLEISDPNYRRYDLYNDSGTKIEFKHKKIVIKSLHSNSSSLAGRTRIFAVIDELSRFDTGDSKRSASEVYRALNNSLLTVKAGINKLRKEGNYDLPDARILSITSPIYATDKGMQLLEQSKNQDSMIGYHLATWEANPNISKEDLSKEFSADPVGADRDFGVNPPGAENPFIRDSRIVDISIDKERSSIFTIEETYFDMEVQDHIFNYVGVELKDVRLNNLANYVIHCDPGKKKDSFCLAIGHLENTIVIIDGAIEVRPIPKGNRQKMVPREVYFPGITNIILDLCNKMTISYISFDRWNSLEQIDKIRKRGIVAIGANLDREDHIKFYEGLRSGNIKLPCPEADNKDPYIERNMPCAKAIKELIGLNDNGKKVDHSSSGSNDMIQCYVGVHRLLVSPGKVLPKRDDLALQQQEYLTRYQKRKPGRVIKLSKFR